MDISYRHQFIFVHVFKTGGTSIRKALEETIYQPEKSPVVRLARRCNLEKLLPPHWTAQLPGHALAREIRDALPQRIFTKFFKFAFVRNPWDLQVSLYHYMLATPKHALHSIVKALPSFEAYLDWLVQQNRYPQKGFLADESGQLLVDFVGKYETLSADFQKVCAKVGVKAELPHLQQSRHEPYPTYYNERTRSLVMDYAKEDIETFGYRFASISSLVLYVGFFLTGIAAQWPVLPT